MWGFEAQGMGVRLAVSGGGSVSGLELRMYRGCT